MAHPQSDRGQDRQHIELDSFSRASAQTAAHYRAQSQKRKQIGMAKRVGILAAALVIAVAGVAVAFVVSLNSRLGAGTGELRKSLSAAEAGKPFYMLLMGVDKSADRAASSEYGESNSAYRTDSIMLARIDPANHKVALVSIHRDTLVDLGEHGQQKINAAYSIGGASYATEVISTFADVPISHYAEIDFDNFVSVVDTIGGIEVDVPVRVDDSKGTGQVIEAGHQKLNGKQALVLCRARHAYDSYGDGDVYRAANQRMVISTIAKKILTLDPATMVATINQLAGSIKTDLDVQSIVGLATQMRELNPQTDISSGMEPTTSLYKNNTWYEICDTTAWRTMMRRVDQGLSPYSSQDQDVTAGVVSSVGTIDSGEATTESTDAATSEALSNVAPEYSGSVEVLNGAGVVGLAGRVSATLNTLGFSATAGDAPNHATSTQIVYNGEDALAQAKAVSEALGGNIPVEANNGDYDTKADVVLILGEDKSTQ